MKEIGRNGDYFSRKRKLATDGCSKLHRTMTTGKDRHKENGSTDPSPASTAKKPKENGSITKITNTIKCKLNFVI